MSVSAAFIRRPVGTSLLAAAVLLAGFIAYHFLPVSPLPQVAFPTISVNAGLPGANPEVMASAVATPLERQFSRIAGVTEMTSSSQFGSTSITLQFDLNRDINGAARDVQAAINAARAQLPANLPSAPNYRKLNPADAPILLLAMTSHIDPLGQMYDIADSILSQKIAQVNGVGQVFVGGGARPAVRVQVNPTQLAAYGIGIEDVRSALTAANANVPKGELQDPSGRWVLTANDQLLNAAAYEPLIITYRNGTAVRLSDVAKVFDSVEDVRAAGLANDELAVIIIVFRQPTANIISTVDNVRALLPQLQASVPPSMHLTVISDRTITIRASVKDVEITLLISIILVILVIFAFLRNPWATAIPSVAVPLSLVGTFAVMYLLNYSIDNLSLMALTISTGFVVDDAIVVIENIARYLEQRVPPVRAAFIGAGEIGFTVLSMSTSLIAVFIPILLMGGIVGRLFREFAVTLSVAVLVSLVVSLTTTPMLCAKFLKAETEHTRHGPLYRACEYALEWVRGKYGVALTWVLRHQFPMIALTLATVCLTVYLYIRIPKGFFPQQDTGRLGGSIIAAQDISFEAMARKQDQLARIVLKDPAVESLGSFTGGGSPNTGRMFITLKPLEQRKVTADQVINRLRSKLSVIPGAMLFLQSVQDVSMGGRQSGAQYQYTLQDENLSELNTWAPRVMQSMQRLPQLRDVNSDQQNKGLQGYLVVDRDTASRFGLQPGAVDSALYDAFGQRQVSTMYKALNQYHVVMEVEPEYQQNPEALKYVYVRSSTGAEIPLSAISHFETRSGSLAVNHQGQFPAITISFNLAPGASLGDATQAIDTAESQMGVPAGLHASFQGTAAAFQSSLANEPYLILAALGAVYIVLGMLYESFIHPLTILSTLPSAGVGALLALMLFHLDLDIIGLIGIILLIGIVKKNAIMMIDFAVDAERNKGMKPEDAIYQASVLRFRPIMMTTLAAMFGGLPLAVGRGTGAELRQPLGITIVGGLIFSQMLTLFTTPVIYLYLDRVRLWLRAHLTRRHQPEPAWQRGD